MAISKAKDGRVVQVWSDRRPQGFSYRTHGAGDREFVDLEGLALVATRPKRQGRNKRAGTAQAGP